MPGRRNGPPDVRVSDGTRTRTQVPLWSRVILTVCSVISVQVPEVVDFREGIVSRQPY